MRFRGRISRLEAAEAQLLSFEEFLAMNQATKIWDFVWGTLLVGMVPMFAFCLVVIVGSFVNPRVEGGWVHNFLVSFLFVASFVVPFATLYFAARWRQKHRLLPASWLVVEILFGLLLAGVAFIFIVAFWGFASLD